MCWYSSQPSKRREDAQQDDPATEHQPREDDAKPSPGRTPTRLPGARQFHTRTLPDRPIALPCETLPRYPFEPVLSTPNGRTAAIENRP